MHRVAEDDPILTLMRLAQAGSRIDARRLISKLPLRLLGGKRGFIRSMLIIIKLRENAVLGRTQL